MDASAADDQQYLAFASLDSRTDGALLAFAIIHLLLAVFFLLFTRRAWRLSCALALALAVEWLVFALSVNVGPVSRNGFSASYSDSSNDLALFGLMTGLALLAIILSLVIPKRFYVGWWLGWILLGILAGASIGVTLLLFRGGQFLIANQGGRWGLIGAFALVGVVAVVVTRWRGATISGCVLGAWLLALGIDLLVNTNTGAAYGLRVLLDRKDIHRPSLQDYQAPLSTCLIFGLSWLVALVLAGFQEILYGRRNFLPVNQDSAEGTRSLEEKKSSQFGLFCLPKRRKANTTQRDLDIEKNATKESAGIAAVYSTTSSSSSTSASSHGFSTVQDSEIRALTENYQRALQALDNPPAEVSNVDEEATRRRQSVETQSVPIAYMPNANQDGSPLTQPRVFVVPGIDQDNDDASVQQEYQRRYEAAQIGFPTSVPMQRSPAMPLKRADSDRGTTYSVPLTNITNSEYHDRDRARPPSWVGNLPWDPAMLRGELDPSTLPRHPENAARNYPVIPQHQVQPSHLATVEAPRPAILPAQQADPAHPPQALAAAPLAIIASTMMVPALASHADQFHIHNGHIAADDGHSEADYEVVDASDVPQSAGHDGSNARPIISRPFLHHGSPTSSPYASRSVDQDLEGSVSTAGIGAVKRLRVQRTSSRDERLHLGDDDLPEHNQAYAASPLSASFPISGEPQSAVDHSDLRSSTLGLPSFARHPDASDITPYLQDLPPPRRPTVVPQHSPIYSNVASVTEGGSPATGSQFFTPFEGSTSTLRVPQGQPQASPAAVQPEEERKQVRFLGEPAKPYRGRRGLFFRQKSGLGK